MLPQSITRFSRPNRKYAVRTCKECDQQFDPRAANQIICRPCRPAYDKRRSDDRTRRDAINAGRVRLGTRVECPRCGDSYSRDVQRATYCPPCRSLAEAEAQRRRYIAVSEVIGRRTRGVSISCPDCGQPFTVSTGNRKRCLACKEIIRIGRKRSENEQVCASPKKSLNRRMRLGIRKSLGSAKGGRSWEALVGFTIADLMAHLETQFLPGMTWSNRSEWHIDHRRPLCSFEFQTPEDPQFREAWALTNLQPLWAVDNLSKGGRWEPPAE